MPCASASFLPERSLLRVPDTNTLRGDFSVVIEHDSNPLHSIGILI